MDNCNNKNNTENKLLSNSNVLELNNNIIKNKNINYKSNNELNNKKEKEKEDSMYKIYMDYMVSRN
tara:strand:+ start:217 stop:414 length:198 start_codon:yes stop_codon:yes gene_type:complete